jgi:hypothetical protein
MTPAHPRSCSALSEGNMFQKKEDGVSIGMRPNYAIPEDFCRIFAEDQSALYLLSLVLTADPEKAEQCFVAGLDDSIHGNPVFKEWARSWSKRMIIKNAIRLIAPVPGDMSPGRSEVTRHASDAPNGVPNLDRWLAAVRELIPFERFVFVLSALEGYSTQECSILLNCTRQEVVDAQANAMRHLARGEGVGPKSIPARKKGIWAAHFLEPIQAS